MTAHLLPPGIEVFERGWLSANNIFHYGQDHVSLVDSGYCAHQKMTLDLVSGAIKKHGLSTLNKLVNTHLHSDHCGGNAALAKAFHCEILIPVAEEKAVSNWNEDLLSYQNLGQECPRFTHDGFYHSFCDGQSRNFIVSRRATWTKRIYAFGVCSTS